MNKNRNKIAAMMMVVAITVSSVAIPVEATVRSVESIGVQREKEIKDVELNEENFPDQAFRNILVEKFDSEGTGILKKDIIENTKHLDISHVSGMEKITNLKGIEYFINLIYLSCNGNRLEGTLDLSKNINLITLSCDANYISDFNLPTSIEKIYCRKNTFEKLDLSKYSNLNTLWCNENKQLNTLEISKNSELKDLNISENKLINDINIEKNEKLEELRANNIGIESINISNNKQLKILSLDNNNISNINLNNNKVLNYLYLENNKLKNIDLLQNENLEFINLQNNEINDINLSNNKALKYLHLERNKLKNLDLSKNENIESINYTSISGTEGKILLNKYIEASTKLYSEPQNFKVNYKEKNIDLSEFGITNYEMNKVNIETDDVNKNGTKLEWTGNTPRIIKYIYSCGGKNEDGKLEVSLYIPENPEEEKPNPPITDPEKPNPPSGNGSGTTNPDQNNNEKPNKPSGNHSKIIGANRYETAAKIADQIGSYNTVILVNSDKSMADGLSAASLSGKKNAPILLVKKDSIPSETMSRIEKADNIYIIGGEGVISKKVENQLKDKKITRISGKDRYETSQKIANLLGGYKMAFIVNGAKGEADAMSVSSVAAKYGAPILLTNGKTSIHTKKANVNYYAIGGRAVISNDLADRYNADRISGVDRYSTNRKIIDEFYYDSKKLYFAKGDTLVDALTASTLAKDNGIVLVSEKSNHTKLEGKDTVQVGGMNFEINLK